MISRDLMDADRLVLNGIDGTTGKYLLHDLTAQELASQVRKRAATISKVPGLRRRGWEQMMSMHREEVPTPTEPPQPERWKILGPVAGIDIASLAEGGWGMILAPGTDPAIIEALQPLIAYRRAQVRDERLCRIFDGEDAYRKGETKRAFLARHGVGYGPVDPHKVPYYLLLVGNPVAIPFSFQYQLDVQYAVGRLCLPSPEAYASYAETVLAAERAAPIDNPNATFFSVRNPDDGATQISADYLAAPLARQLAAAHPDWTIQTHDAQDATKARLARLLGGDETPTLLFTASHGMAFPAGNRRQLPHQGALLCQEWPGPNAWQQAIPEDFYLAAEDIADDARPGGLISFHFGCYAAGTPRHDNFGHRETDPRWSGMQQATIAPHDFVARLPQRLLGHPRGGALAVVAHVDRTWGFSFLWPGVGEQLQAFECTLRGLMTGHRVGTAMEFFNKRFAELSVDFADLGQDSAWGAEVDAGELVRLWTARNDARSYVILGDPAVRLPVAASTTGS